MIPGSTGYRRDRLKNVGTLFMTEFSAVTSGQQFFHHVSGLDPSQSGIESLELVTEPIMVNSQQVQ